MSSKCLNLILLGCIAFAASHSTAFQGEENGFIPLGSVPNGAGVNQKFFWLSMTEETWRVAWHDCINFRNGILASIDDPEEDEYIKNILILNSIDKAWTSGIYMAGWMWGANGNLIGGNFSNWGAGYPGPTSQPVLVFGSGFSVYEWRTEAPASKHRYICHNRATES